MKLPILTFKGKSSIMILILVGVAVGFGIVMSMGGSQYIPIAPPLGSSSSSQIIVTSTPEPGQDNLQLHTFSIITIPPTPTIAPTQTMSLTDCHINDASFEFESKVLRAYAPQIAGPSDTLKVWFMDEKTPQLGVSKITYNGPGTPEVREYPITLMASSTAPQGATSIQAGAGYSNEPDVHWRGTDTNGRPIFPAIFLTDITTNANDMSGDWEQAKDNAKPFPPDDIFGTWKVSEIVFDSAWNKTVDVGPDADVNNVWDLGPGSDPAPAEAKGLPENDENFGTEARWQVSKLGLLAGHSYRVQFMVHDGDSTAVGGDVDEACGTIRIP